MIITITTLLITASSCTQTEQPQKEDIIDAPALLREVKTTQYFTDEAVKDEDITKILNAGINAPSAINKQPWHFTAITNKEVTQKLADAMKSMKPPAPPKDMPNPPATNGDKPAFKSSTKAGIGDAPLTIVVSCKEGSELDAGLATQNMCAEAQLLGYGTKILTSPTMALNGENKAEYYELLNIPQDQKVASVIIIGKAESSDKNPDAISSATERNPFDTVVSVIK